ncbi:hypothetical protein BHU72_14650 [Desulfuribacillus stibiiarsenatis]|uniref:HTH cro/C1-type domain-containing protein n=1 Tax=Desulfuribacillus stibiiarsenatis TaxID=1390249 RepID=A0A1E5L7G6_9FIRM|nr:helix-turn-helix domain-containing protein [Desulfuribacillus stibiiarsenatis]OEH86066.1 hypothetical protein BHU72_14650 [Desulfuribacillus stibiiarsenatis]
MSIGTGDRIKYFRKLRKFTQKELGDKVNRSPQVISNWEREYSDPDHEDIALLSQALNCSTDYLLGRTNNPSIAEVHNIEDEKTPDEQLKELLSDPTMLVAFSDYDNWSDDDKKELIAYLRAKKMSRDVNKLSE